MNARPDFRQQTSGLVVDEAGGVVTVTLDRVEAGNAFDKQMVNELAKVWQLLRDDDNVRVVIVTGAGDRDFCIGVDPAESWRESTFDPFTHDDLGRLIGPKRQQLWKPIIGAVNGVASAEAFFLLAECDIILAAEHATFFDPRVTEGTLPTSELLPLMRRMAFPELLRMALVGDHERISASTAQRLGLVDETVPGLELESCARQIADVIASAPPRTIQSTLRTIWAARDLPGWQGIDLANVFLQLGASTEAREEGQALFRSGVRPKPRLR